MVVMTEWIGIVRPTGHAVDEWMGVPGILLVGACKGKKKGNGLTEVLIAERSRRTHAAQSCPKPLFLVQKSEVRYLL